MGAAEDTSELLPPLYAAWVRELLDGSIPRETRATCDNCAMCGNGTKSVSSSVEYFDPAVKCCTYVPVLHNFLIGRILLDDDPSATLGQATVEARINEGIALS